MKILILQIRRVGDVLLATPALEALRRAYPKAQIDFFAEPPCDEVLEGNPHLDQVLRYDPKRPLQWLLHLRRERYDWVVDFLGNPRSALLTFASRAEVRAGPDRTDRRWSYNHRFPHHKAPLYSAMEKLLALSTLGVPVPERPRPSVFLSTERRERARSLLARSGPGPWFGLLPASRRQTRRWPANSYGRLARLASDRLKARGLVLWGPGERSIAEAVARASSGAAWIAPPTPHLLDLAALLEKCQVVVTNCNGPKHLAVALGVPTLTLHFSSDPRAWNPPNDPRHPTLRADELHCIGCRLKECPYNLECMSLLTPERVLDRLREMPLAPVAT